MVSFTPVEKSLWLHRVCEDNFLKLKELIPQLDSINESVSCDVPGKPTLHAEIIERSPYTLTLELTHDFGEAAGGLLEPAVKIRICLDAQTAEVLSDHARPFVLDVLRDDPLPREVLDYKWRLNYFLFRWLDHCLASDYQFGMTEAQLGLCTISRLQN